MFTRLEDGLIDLRVSAECVGDEAGEVRESDHKGVNSHRPSISEHCHKRDRCRGSHLRVFSTFSF